MPSHPFLSRRSGCHPPPVPQRVAAVTVLCCSLFIIPTSQQPQHSGAPLQLLLLLAVWLLSFCLHPDTPLTLLVWPTFLQEQCCMINAWILVVCGIVVPLYIAFYSEQAGRWVGGWVDAQGQLARLQHTSIKAAATCARLSLTLLLPGWLAPCMQAGVPTRLELPHPSIWRQQQQGRRRGTLFPSPLAADSQQRP